MRKGLPMQRSVRVGLAIAVVVLLAGLALFIGQWYQPKRAVARETAAARSTDLTVTTGADRGPGSLREALFVAASAPARPKIVIRVDRIALATALPPLVNPRGTDVVGPQAGVTIDAQNLRNVPVFDITGAGTAVSGIVIRGCPATGVLVRAGLFRLSSTTIESCDVAIDVAENANDLSITGSRFTGNRIGIRFAGSIPNATVANNAFEQHRDAGVWAVRSSPDRRNAAIVVRDNRFSGDRLGIVTGNIALQVDHNDIAGAREAAVHLIGAGAVVRRNRISGGAAMGIVAENARGAAIESNELDRVTAYAVMARGSADTLVRDNRIHSCGYGLAFVLGVAGNPSTAVDNSIIGPRFNGIDVIGDSPILRRNRVLNPRGLPLHVEDFRPSGGQTVRSKPFLEDNNFSADQARVASGAAPPKQEP